jgi:hypothetical protein
LTRRLVTTPRQVTWRPSVHDELLAKFFVMLDQIGVEEVLVGIVFASKLLNDRRIELVADFFEIVSRLMVGNFAHRESPAFGVGA